MFWAFLSWRWTVPSLLYVSLSLLDSQVDPHTHTRTQTNKHTHTHIPTPNERQIKTGEGLMICLLPQC
jgi:hypothetical protein